MRVPCELGSMLLVSPKDMDPIQRPLVGPMNYTRRECHGRLEYGPRTPSIDCSSYVDVEPRQEEPRGTMTMRDHEGIRGSSGRTGGCLARVPRLLRGKL